MSPQDRDKQILQCTQQVVNQCFCVGPQDGKSLCPCQMRSVKIIDGRYVKTTDLGPATREDSILEALKGWAK